MKQHFLLATSLVASVPAFAGTEPKTSKQIPIFDLYRVPLNGAESEIVQDQFLNAFFSLLPTLREHNLSLRRWFREDHIMYLSEYLNDEEKKEMIPIFEKIDERIQRGEHNMKEVLVGVGPAYIMGKAGKIDFEVMRLKEMHKDVIRTALIKHEYEKKQPYGKLPYSYHLRQVRAVLKRFGFGPKDSIFGLKIGTAAWLHDVLEDTNMTYEQLADLFGTEIADIVQGVTKVDKEGLTDEERIRKTYERTRLLKASRILKLADRIANVEEGLTDYWAGRPSKVPKYFAEWPIFYELLYVPGEADAMWDHLRRLLTDVRYAKEFAIDRLYKSGSFCDAELATSTAR